MDDSDFFRALNDRRHKLDRVVQSHYTSMPYDPRCIEEDAEQTLDLLQYEFGCLRDETILVQVLASLEKRCCALDKIDAIVVDARKLAYINVIFGIATRRAEDKIAKRLFYTFFFEEMINNHYADSLPCVREDIGLSTQEEKDSGKLLYASMMYVADWQHLISSFFITHEFSHLYLSKGRFVRGFNSMACDIVKSVAVQTGKDLDERVGNRNDYSALFRGKDGSPSFAPVIPPSRIQALVAARNETLRRRWIEEILCDLLALFVVITQAVREGYPLVEAIRISRNILHALDGYATILVSGANVVREKLPWEIDELSGPLKESRSFIRANTLDVMGPLLIGSGLRDFAEPLRIELPKGRFEASLVRDDTSFHEHFTRSILGSLTKCGGSFFEHRRHSIDYDGGKLRRKRRLTTQEKNQYLGYYDYVSELLFEKR